MPPLSSGITRIPMPVLANTRTGIGGRVAHFDKILETKPDVGFLELHSENFFCDGGPQLQYLDKLRASYPISLHCVGLSLGSAAGISRPHLLKLKALMERTEPVLVSDHLSWSGAGNVFVPDLLPLPMTEEALSVMAANIDTAQTELKRQILIENPSVYIAFIEQDIAEAEFLASLVAKTGCGLLLDVNNIHVSAQGAAFDVKKYFEFLPTSAVQEIHLAGYQVNVVDEVEVLIDAHNHPVSASVWEIYKQALAHFGDVPTLIEWDADLPLLSVLVDEAHKADNIRRAAGQEASLVRTA